MRMLDKNELEDILKKEGKAELVCEFCKNKYLISYEEIKTMIKNFKNNDNNVNQNRLPKITIPSFDDFLIKLSVGILFLILLLISPDSYNRFLLSISTIILTYVQIKSGKRFISSLGWSVTLLSIGLIFGGLFETNSFIQELSNNSLSIEKIQSIPAILILWIGVILL